MSPFLVTSSGYNGSAKFVTRAGNTALQSCNSNPNAKGFDDAAGSDNTAVDMQGMVVRQVSGVPDLGPPGTCRTCQ